MRKRDVLRFVPGFGRVAHALDGYEAERTELAAANHALTDENARLRGILQQVMFNDGSGLLDPDAKSRPEAGGLAVPAPVLRYLVAGTDELDWFLEGGRRGADTVRTALARVGKDLAECRSLLDLGAGCGRVVRHLRTPAGPKLHGCDCNVTAVRWCQKHLPFAAFAVNGLEPPLPYPAGAFDLVYAFSVFTHFDAGLQPRWMAEVRRVLAPGGLALISLHGDGALDALTPGERAAYMGGKLVVREATVAGTNYCAAYHPDRYVRGDFSAGFEVADHIPLGAKGNPPQDLYVFRAV